MKVCVLVCTVIALVGAEKIHRRDVEQITLFPNTQTTYRRSPAVAQIHCTGGNARTYNHMITQIECIQNKNEQWTCTAQMPNTFKLDNVRVTCEGYDHADDPSILEGSCGVQYDLMMTPLGEEQYGLPPQSGTDPGFIIFIIILLFMAFMVWYRWGTEADNGATYHDDTRPDSPDDRPPPYDKNQQQFANTGTSFATRAGLATAAGLGMSSLLGRSAPTDARRAGRGRAAGRRSPDREDAFSGTDSWSHSASGEYSGR